MAMEFDFGNFIDNLFLEHLLDNVFIGICRRAFDQDEVDWGFCYTLWSKKSRYRFGGAFSGNDVCLNNG